MRDDLRYSIQGYLQIQISGYMVERFLNLCKNNEIEIWKLSCDKEGYKGNIALTGFRKIRPLVRKSRVKVKILGRYGLPFFLYENRKRKCFGVGFVLFFVILFVLTQFIWNITFEGNTRFTNDMLLHFLQSQEITYGILKNQVDCDELEAVIRSEYPEIIWVSARISGTKLLIKIKENEAMGSIPIKDETPRNIISDQNGVITSMIVRSGKSQIAIGDEIEIGQLLISGVIPIVDEYGELLNEKIVRADGIIMAKLTSSYIEELPYFKMERIYTGKERLGIGIQLFWQVERFMIPTWSEELWEYTAENKQVVLLDDFYLPIWIQIVTAKEYQLSEQFYKQEELNQQMELVNQNKKQKILEKGIEILENNVKIVNSGTGWQIQGTFVTEEAIGIGEEIDFIDECN